VFDISFVELLTVGAVALVVLGPERLPAAARTVGGLLRRARSSWQSVRDEFEREVAASGVRRDVEGLREQMTGIAGRVESTPGSGGPAIPGDVRERRPPHD
jgi:sec-independent protein translocase protein TatB